jgi:hypothetical protein
MGIHLGEHYTGECMKIYVIPTAWGRMFAWKDGILRGSQEHNRLLASNMFYSQLCENERIDLVRAGIIVDFGMAHKVGFGEDPAIRGLDSLFKEGSSRTNVRLWARDLEEHDILRIWPPHDLDIACVPQTWEWMVWNLVTGVVPEWEQTLYERSQA